MHWIFWKRFLYKEGNLGNFVENYNYWGLFNRISHMI
jgi:hypothetical protein